MDPSGNVFGGQTIGLPKDATLLFQNTTLQYEDGRIADSSSGVYNHHVLSINPMKRAPTVFACPGYNSSLGLASIPIAAIEDVGYSMYTTSDWKFNSGYYIGKSDRFMTAGEVVNYSDEQKSIYLVSELEYVPGKPEGLMDVSIQLLGVNHCESLNMSLHPPVGWKVFSFKSQNVTILQNGYLLSRRRSCLL
jgi:hypothetical protein